MKKKLVILLSFLFVFSFALTAQAKSVQLTKNKKYRVGKTILTFKEGTKVELFPNNAVKSAKMAGNLNYYYNNRKIIFEGSPRSIYFHKNGRIRMGVIGRRTTVPTKEGLMTAKPNTGVSFHDNGHVNMLISYGVPKIKGVLFKSSKQIYFHKKNGKLHYSTLLRDTKYSGLIFKKNTYLYFHNNGKLAKGTLAKGKTVKKGLFKKKKLKAGKTYSFNRKGRVK